MSKDLEKKEENVIEKFEKGKYEIQDMKSIINERIETGDFKILSRVLNLPYQVARLRYIHGNKLAVNTMYKIVFKKQQIIKKLVKELKTESV